MLTQDNDSTVPIRRSEWLAPSDEEGQAVMHTARSVHTVTVLGQTEHYRIVKREGSWRGEDKRQWIAGTLQLLEVRPGDGDVLYYQRVGKPHRANRQWRTALTKLNAQMQSLESVWSQHNEDRRKELLQKATGEQIVEATERNDQRRRRQVLQRLEALTGLKEVSLDAIEALVDMVEKKQYV